MGAKRDSGYLFRFRRWNPISYQCLLPTFILPPLSAISLPVAYPCLSLDTIYVIVGNGKGCAGTFKGLRFPSLPCFQASLDPDLRSISSPFATFPLAFALFR